MVAAVSMVRDEADILETTLRRMHQQADMVIVADNLSQDGTRAILDRLQDELGTIVVDDPEPGYFQSQKITALADQAREAGATWIVPFDADEVWLTRDGRRLGDALEQLPDEILVAHADLYDHVVTGKDPDGDPVSRIQWRRPDPGALPKVACRALPGLTVLAGNHGARYVHTDHPATVTNLVTIRHFPYRSREQFISKARNGAAAYAATDLPEHTGGHWRGYGRILHEHGEDALAEVFATWFRREHPRRPIVIQGDEYPPLVHDPVP